MAGDSLFLVVIVLETTDLALAVDSVAAVFGVTRDPFIVYSSNVCAILGLRALYFLLAGILPYFQYLDEGLAIVLMFIGGKMLVEPWTHISTQVSLSVVGSVIAIAVVASVIAARWSPLTAKPAKEELPGGAVPPPISETIRRLADPDVELRAQAAHDLFNNGSRRTLNWFNDWRKDEEFYVLVVQEQSVLPRGRKIFSPKLTIGIAVSPETFDKIRAANASPRLADAPADQDVLEFELEFRGHEMPPSRLDILTTKSPGGDGAIARFLNKFGEGIQQVEIDVTDVDRATEILRTRFQAEPIYPVTRPGANGTRVNFFLVTSWNGSKVLAELVEQPNSISPTDFALHEKA